MVSGYEKLRIFSRLFHDFILEYLVSWIGMREFIVEVILLIQKRLLLFHERFDLALEFLLDYEQVPLFQLLDLLFQNYVLCDILIMDLHSFLRLLFHDNLVFFEYLN